MSRIAFVFASATSSSRIFSRAIFFQRADAGVCFRETMKQQLDLRKRKASFLREFDDDELVQNVV